MYGASAAFFFFCLFFFFSLFFLFVLEARHVLRQLHLEQLRREKEEKKETGKKSGRRHRSGTYAPVLLYRVLLFFFSLCFGLYVNLRMRITTLFKSASAGKREMP